MESSDDRFAGLERRLQALEQEWPKANLTIGGDRTHSASTGGDADADRAMKAAHQAIADAKQASSSVRDCQRDLAGLRTQLDAMRTGAASTPAESLSSSELSTKHTMKSSASGPAGSHGSGTVDLDELRTALADVRSAAARADRVST